MYPIRSFNPTENEYMTMIQLHNTVWPDEPHFPLEMWRENDDEWPGSAFKKRFVMEDKAGTMVAVGNCFEKYWQHQPGTVHLDFEVLPIAQAQDLERQLYDFMLDYLFEHRSSLQVIATETREDRPQRIQFLTERGFQLTMRSPRSALHVADFDAACFQKIRSQTAEQGIKIYTLTQLYDCEPNWKEKLYELRWTIIQDVPAVEPPTRPTMAEFENMVLDDPALNGDAWFIAVDETEKGDGGVGPFVGMSNLWLNDPTHKRLDGGLTGVLRNYRRQGIATALKVCTIEFAQRLGAETIDTDNEENNPMYDLNLQLGFRPKPAWVSYRKALS